MIGLFTNMDRVLVLGHSFISRLDSLFRFNNQFPDSFDLNQCTIMCYGRPGGTIDSLWDDNHLVDILLNFCPTLVILQVGGNDLCRSSLRPETLTFKIIDFMNSLENDFNVQQIMVCEIFKRQKPRNISATEYEAKRQTVNRMLLNILEESRSQHYWRHLRLMCSPLPIFGHDGVHLSHLGQHKFFRSLRLAIMHALVM